MSKRELTEQDKIYLLYGKNMEFSEGITVLNHNMKFIIEYGWDIFYSVLSLCNAKISSELKDKGITLFDVLISKQYIKDFLIFIDLFIEHDDENGIHILPRMRSIMINNKGKIGDINKDNIQDLLDYIRFIYAIPKQAKKESDRQDLSEDLKELLRSLEAEQEKVNKARNKSMGITIPSIIESISMSGSYNLFNIWDLTIYQLMQEYKRLSIFKSNENTMTALYSGLIDTKKFDINSEHWARESS